VIQEHEHLLPGFFGLLEIEMPDVSVMNELKTVGRISFQGLKYPNRYGLESVDSGIAVQSVPIFVRGDIFNYRPDNPFGMGRCPLDA